MAQLQLHLAAQNRSGIGRQFEGAELAFDLQITKRNQLAQHCAPVRVGKIRTDPALGPIFNREIDDWDHHLAKMCDFWSSVLLMTGRFKGAPMAAHARLAEVRPTHFARWLHLFRQTAQEVCPPEAAALFVAKSKMIAQSLQLHIAAVRGELPPVRTVSAASAKASGTS